MVQANVPVVVSLGSSLLPTNGLDGEGLALQAGLPDLFQGLLMEGLVEGNGEVLGGEIGASLLNLPLEIESGNIQSFERFQLSVIQPQIEELNGGLNIQQLQLGQGPALPIQGEALVVQQFIGRVQEIYTKLVVEGGLTMEGAGDADQLATALVKLGMNPEEANITAARITTMLEILDQQQNLNDEELGALAMMMLAAGQQGQDGQRVILQVVSVESVVVEQQNLFVSRSQIEKSLVLSKLNVSRLTWDVSRDILGIDGGEGKKEAGSQVLALEPMVKDVVVEGTRKTKDVVVRVEPAVQNSEVVLSLPEVAVAEVKPLIIHTVESSEKVVQSNVSERTGLPLVYVKDVIDAPKGEIVYKYVEDKKAGEVLKVVQPLEELGGARFMLEQPVRNEIIEHVVKNVEEGKTFAERLMQAQQAGVGQQVVVQMKPLIEQGGGVVRVVLNPAELGEIRIELSVVDGKVQGSMSATQSATLEQLARDLHSLRHGLAEAGLKLGEQGINLMLSNQNNGQQSFANQQAFEGHGFGQGSMGGRGSENVVGDSDLDSEILSSRWVSPDRILDIEA